MRHSRSYRVISEFHLCIFAVSLFHVSLPGKTEKSAKPITSRLCGYKKDHATDCLNKQFTLRGVFHMEVTTRFELVNEGFADLCLTTWPRHHMSRKPWYNLLLFFGAADEARTRYLHLGKVALYQMSYGRILYILYEEYTRNWCLRSESNQWHGDFQSPALPTELQRQMATRIRLELTTSSVTG